MSAINKYLHLSVISDEALDMEDCRRGRSESSTGEDMNATHVAVSYLEKHYPQYKTVSISSNTNNNSGIDYKLEENNTRTCFRSST